MQYDKCCSCSTKRWCQEMNTTQTFTLSFYFFKAAAVVCSDIYQQSIIISKKDLMENLLSYVKQRQLLLKCDFKAMVGK